MLNVISWFVRGQCLRHAEPLFDRDASGPIFRCPRCLHSWPRMSGQAPLEESGRMQGAIDALVAATRKAPTVARPRLVKGHAA